MPHMLDYDGNFFHSIDWYELLAETTGLDSWYLTSDTGVLPCKDVDGSLWSLTNFYSLEWAPLGEFASLLDRLGRKFECSFVKDDSVEKVFRDHGWKTFRQHQYANWTAEIDGGFTSYFGQRPSQLRNTIKRKSKALNKAHKVELAVYRDPKPAEWVEVYDASWKRSEPFPLFMPGLMETTAGLGILRLGMAYIDGEPAASQLWIVESGRAVIYKLAYKEKFKDTSIGSILSHEMFREAIDVDGVSLIDYGVGDEPYKCDWMTRRGEVHQLTCYDRSFTGRMCASARFALKALI